MAVERGAMEGSICRAVDLIVHELAPYRAHLVRRFVSEMPEVAFRVLVTTEVAGFAWKAAHADSTEEVETLLVGKKETIADQGKLRRFPAEWIKGGRLIRLLEQRDADGAVIFGYGDAAHRRLLRWCHGRGIPALLSADSNIRADRATGLKALIKQWQVGGIVRRCSAVLPWGSLGVEYFRKYGAQPEKIFLVPHEPDYSLIQHPPLEALRVVRDRFGLHDGRRRVMYCGRLAREKRVDLLLSAFVKLASQRSQWDLLIIGDGPLGPALRKSVPPLLKSRVTFTGAITEPAVVAALYHCGDVLVLPSDYEPWGMVVNEALAAGLSLVCRMAVGAGADLVRDGVNGRVFAEGSSEQLLECLLDVTHMDRLLEMKSASGDILNDWRRAHDPVQGLRNALRFCGIL